MKVNYKGRVLDGYNQPLVGANIISTTGPKRGVITDIDGYFTLYEDEGQFFQISYVGFKPQLFLVTANTYATPVFRMAEDVTQLNEVVLTPRQPGGPSKVTVKSPGIVTGTVPGSTGITANGFKTLPAPSNQNNSNGKKDIWQQLKDNPLAAAGLFLAGFFVVGAVFGKVAKASDRAEENRIANAGRKTKLLPAKG